MFLQMDPSSLHPPPRTQISSGPPVEQVTDLESLHRLHTKHTTNQTRSGAALSSYQNQSWRVWLTSLIIRLPCRLVSTRWYVPSTCFLGIGYLITCTLGCWHHCSPTSWISCFISRSELQWFRRRGTCILRSSPRSQHPSEHHIEHALRSNKHQWVHRASLPAKYDMATWTPNTY